MSKWRPALRMARRDLRRHKVRAALTCLLVALPVLVGTVAALVAHNDRWTTEVEARQRFFGADGLAAVSEFTQVRPASAIDGWPEPVRGAHDRDPAGVDLAALLPAGSRFTPAPATTITGLPSGGQAQVVRVDLADPLTKGFVDIRQGRAPASADEVAITRPAAGELGLFRDGKLRSDAEFELAGGVKLQVVGIVESGRNDWDFHGMSLIAPPDSAAPTLEQLDDYVEPLAFLVDLPTMDRAATKKLVSELALAGVALQPRDAVIHPKAWRADIYEPGPIDLTPLLVGALCILVGLIEVVLLVGAAFSVAARRQVRDLGLLATNGGAAADVRRVLLAQGVVLGVLSSVVGATAGVVTFLAGAGVLERRVIGHQLYGHEVLWWAVIVIAALGSVTSVVAALLPGWRIARLTPVDSLSGRFPLRPGESRAHRPAFVLAGGGLLLLVAGGVATANAERSYPNWVGVAVFTAGLGLVALVAGAVWSTPYVVRRVAALGGALPMSGRYAFRDAGRHRFRSAAAVMALMVTVAGAVLAGFGWATADRTRALDDGLGPNVVTVDLCCSAADAARLAAVSQTLERVIDPQETATTSTLALAGDPSRALEVARIRDTVQVVDEASLRMLVKADAEALQIFRSGGVLTTYDRVVRDGQIRLGVFGGGRKTDNRWVLPATRVAKVEGLTPYTQPTIVSSETAVRLGTVPVSTQIVVRNAEPLTNDTLERLRVYGFWVSSDDPARAVAQLAEYAGIGIAGLLTALVIGITVALAAAESRDDVATLAAVGAAPWTRRRFGAMHGLFLGLVGTGLGVAIGVPAGLAFTQLDGLPGVDMAWLHVLGTVAVVLPLSWVIGGLVTPSRFRLTRRVA